MFLANTHYEIAQWHTKYAYALLGSLFFAIPSIVLISVSKVSISRLAVLIAYFAYATVLLETTAATLHQWIFTGEYPPKHREVYHDKDTCPDGKRIKNEHRESGTGGKKHCLECDKVS